MLISGLFHKADVQPSELIDWRGFIAPVRVELKAKQVTSTLASLILGNVCSGLGGGDALTWDVVRAEALLLSMLFRKERRLLF